MLHRQNVKNSVGNFEVVGALFVKRSNSVYIPARSFSSAKWRLAVGLLSLRDFRARSGILDHSNLDSDFIDWFGTFRVDLPTKQMRICANIGPEISTGLTNKISFVLKAVNGLPSLHSWVHCLKVLFKPQYSDHLRAYSHNWLVDHFEHKRSALLWPEKSELRFSSLYHTPFWVFIIEMFTLDFIWNKKILST